MVQQAESLVQGEGSTRVGVDNNIMALGTRDSPMISSLLVTPDKREQPEETHREEHDIALPGTPGNIPSHKQCPPTGPTSLKEGRLYAPDR